MNASVSESTRACDHSAIINVKHQFPVSSHLAERSLDEWLLGHHYQAISYCLVARYTESQEREKTEFPSAGT